MEITLSFSLKLVFVFWLKFTFGNRYNVSLSELSSCKEYRIESGYVYRNFFLLENIENNRNANETLRLKFYVMAQSNAHILLSPVDNAKKNDRVYEIVVGAGKNTFSTIRPNIGGSQLVVKKQNGLLNGIDPTPILVTQKYDGTIDVSIPTFVGPLIFYKDPTPLHIKYVSFSSYGTTSARWFYDCKGDKAARLEIESKHLSRLDRLQQYLFSNYSIFTVPQGLTKVRMGVTIKGSSFDIKRSVFQTRLELKLKWQDDRLQWNPSIYNNITALKSFEVHFWTPALLIMNGAQASFTKFDPEYFGIIYSNGSVEAFTKQQTIETWCKEPEDNNWPQDQLHCSVDFGIDGNQLALDYDLNTKIRTGKMTESTEWRISRISFAAKKMIRYNEEFISPNSTYTGTTLNMLMRRNMLFYRKVFFTPAVAAVILILLSFQMKRFLRGILNLLALNLLLGTFVVLTTHTPLTYVPRIVHIYEAYIGIACLSYGLAICSRWLADYPPKVTPPGFMLSVVNHSVLRFILVMRFADATEYLSIQHEPWKQVGKVLDRIVFIVLFISFMFISFMGFK